MPVSLPTGKGHHIPWARGNELGAGHSCKSFAPEWLISRKGCNTRKSLVLLQCILVYSNEAACCRSWLCRAFANVAGQMVTWRSFPNGAAEWMGRTGGLNTSATCNYSACWEWKSPLVIDVLSGRLLPHASCRQPPRPGARPSLSTAAAVHSRPCAADTCAQDGRCNQFGTWKVWASTPRPTEVITKRTQSLPSPRAPRVSQ